MARAAASILVVDDDPAILDIITQVLVAEGYRARGYRTARDALAAVRQAPPELILLDLWMPEMDGWEFRRRQLMLASARHVPVVLLSAGGRLDEHHRALGAAASIAKPFDLGDLLTTVATVLGRDRPA